MIEAVLFDYGMVLSGPADPVAWNVMLEQTGLEDAPFKEAYWAPRHAYDRGNPHRRSLLANWSASTPACSSHRLRSKR